MARPKPWLKMWIEWIHDPKMLGLTLAETGVWWKLITLAQQCAAEGQLVKGNGSPLSLPEIANSLHISTPKDMKTLQSMIQKMEAANSLSWNNKTLTIIHFAERQEQVASATKEAVRERVRRHRERQSVTPNPLPELGEEIREALLHLPTYSSYITEHEAVKDTLQQLGLKKGYISRAEVTIPSGRVDLIWANEYGENIAAFEIDARFPKWKSIVKLRALSCPQSFVILRAGTTPFGQEGNITLIGLGRPRLKELKNDGQEHIPTPPTVKEREAEVEVEGNAVTSVTAEAILAEIANLHEENFGIITPILAEKFKDFVENYRGPIDWIKEAFAEALTNNVRKWAYVEKILDTWQSEGRKTHGERKQRKDTRDEAHQRGDKEPSPERYRQSLER